MLPSPQKVLSCPSQSVPRPGNHLGIRLCPITPSDVCGLVPLGSPLRGASLAQTFQDCDLWVGGSLTTNNYPFDPTRYIWEAQGWLGVELQRVSQAWELGGVGGSVPVLDRAWNRGDF